MVTATSRNYIRSVEALREVIGDLPPDSPARRKELPALDDHCRTFIEKSPFVLMSTSNASGRCDVTPRGDGPGFVLVLDDHMLAIPDRPGNRRIDSMQNIIENPHAGLLFLVPNVDETLRVNGRAAITDDPELLSQMAVQSKVPKVAVIVEVEEVFFHCARAFRRAKLWEPETWIERSELPTLGQILADQLKSPEDTGDVIDERLAKANKHLY